MHSFIFVQDSAKVLKLAFNVYILLSRSFKAAVPNPGSGGPSSVLHVLVAAQ